MSHYRIVCVYAGTPVRLCGDGRYDSPGHNSRYCTYTMIDAVSTCFIYYFICIYLSICMYLCNAYRWVGRYVNMYVTYEGRHVGMHVCV